MLTVGLENAALQMCNVSKMLRSGAASLRLTKVMEPLAPKRVHGGLSDMAIPYPAPIGELAANQVMRAGGPCGGGSHPDEGRKLPFNHPTTTPCSGRTDVNGRNLSVDFARKYRLAKNHGRIIIGYEPG